jgi:selenium-binding protein 1
MGSAVGTTPGRLIETDANFDIIHEWPEDVDGTLNILGEQFSPHGLSIDWKNKLILTSDFVEPISILKPTTGVRHANTLRLWDLDSRKIINTLTIPDVSIQRETRNSVTNTGIGWWYPRCQVHSQSP